jgi:geranylgeranyl diphosphate/geranylgeranyl-bacteriochlorophyllide a reductase
MPIVGGFVGMVDREVFDAWLRDRACMAGAELRTATFEGATRGDDGELEIRCGDSREGRGGSHFSVRARAMIGADGANSAVVRHCLPDAETVPFVAAYHEIVTSPQAGSGDHFDATRCDVWYQGRVSPDFYGWVFPHGDKTSVGVGSARRGFSLRGAVTTLREAAGLGGAETIRREGAPIPLRPLKCWDDGNNVVLAGDAAGIVAPASGEGIYYAMSGGRMAADAVDEFLNTRRAASLATARKRFMRAHGKVFWMLGMMQRFWYANDSRRERFVSMCADPDVQHLTWEAYMHKRLVRARPAAHVRIFVKDLAHLLGVARV